MLLCRLPDGAPEIFRTVQGEGPTTGVPSVFVRLADCNLACTFCDTAHSWNWRKHDRASETMELEVAAIASAVVALAGDGVRNVVLTGGEPLLQSEPLGELAKTLRARGFAVEIETNGTLVPDDTLATYVTQWNVSPKLASSGNGERARRKPDVLAWFSARPEAFFKLVIANDEDLAEADALVSAFDVPRTRVTLMPEGAQADVVRTRSRWLADACTARGYRLGTRLHLFVWGDERGR